MHAMPAAVSAVDVFLGQHLGDRPGSHEFGIEQDALREVLFRQFEVVHRGQHRAALRLPVEEDVRQLLGGEEVQAGQRLVEQKNVGALGEGARQEDPLLLAAGKPVNLPVR